MKSKRDLQLLSIGSSSSGNSYLIRSGTTDLILDVGLSAKAIRAAMHVAGATEESIRGILVTHEHIDHVKSIRAMSRCCKNAEVIASYGTASSCPNFEYVPDDRLKLVIAQEFFDIGDITVKSFALSHDAAEPISYVFECGDTRLAVVTDTGVITDEIREEIYNADMLVLESNHEIEMLEMGPYPYSLKKRILSDHGHLSNVSAGAVLAESIESKLTRFGRSGSELDVMLAHLSTQNNTPDNAEITVKHILGSCGYEEGVEYGLRIAAKSDPTEM